MPEGSRNGISAEKNTDFKFCDEDEEEDENLRLKKFFNVNFIFDLFRAAISMDGKIGGGDKNGNSSPRMLSAGGGKDSHFVMLVLSQKQKENIEINLLIDRLRQNGVTCVFFNGDDLRNGNRRPVSSDLSLPEVEKSRQRQHSKSNSIESVEENGKKLFTETLGLESSPRLISAEECKSPKPSSCLPPRPTISSPNAAKTLERPKSSQNNEVCSPTSSSAHNEIVQNGPKNGMDISEHFNGTISIPILPQVISPSGLSPCYSQLYSKSPTHPSKGNKILVAPLSSPNSVVKIDSSSTPLSSIVQLDLSPPEVQPESSDVNSILLPNLDLDLNPKIEESPIASINSEDPPARKRRRKRRKYPYLSRKPARKKNIWKNLDLDSSLNSNNLSADVDINPKEKESEKTITVASEDSLALDSLADVIEESPLEESSISIPTLPTPIIQNDLNQKPVKKLKSKPIKTKSKRESYNRKKQVKEEEDIDKVQDNNSSVVLNKSDPEPSDDPYAFVPDSEDDDLDLTFSLSPSKQASKKASLSPKIKLVPVPKKASSGKKSRAKKAEKEHVIVKLKGLKGFSPEVSVGHQVSKRSTNNSNSSSLFRTPEKKVILTTCGNFSPDITNELGFGRSRGNWRTKRSMSRSVSVSSSPSSISGDDDDEEDFLPGRSGKRKRKSKSKKKKKSKRNSSSKRVSNSRSKQVQKKTKKDCVHEKISTNEMVIEDVEVKVQEEEEESDEIPVLVKEDEVVCPSVIGQEKKSGQDKIDQDDTKKRKARKKLKLTFDEIYSSASSPAPLLNKETEVPEVNESGISEANSASTSISSSSSCVPLASSSAVFVGSSLASSSTAVQSQNIQEDDKESEKPSKESTSTNPYIISTKSDCDLELEKGAEEGPKPSSGMVKISSEDAEALIFKFPPYEETHERKVGEEETFMEAMQLRRPSFYSQIAGNVRNNLENHLDGRSEANPNQGKVGKRRKRARNGFLLHHGDNFPEDPEAPYKLHLATQIILKLNKRRGKFKPKVENRKTLLSYLKLVPKRSSRAGKGSPLVIPQDEVPAKKEGEEGAGSVFSGEWIQERNFICNVCGHVEDYFWNMVHHKGEIHPGVVVTHVELPDLPPVGFRVPPPVPNVDVLPPPASCTKCNASFTTYPDLHRHIFECAGNGACLEEIQPEPVPTPKKKPKRKRGFNSFKRRLSNTPKKKADQNSPVKRKTSEVFKCEFCTREFKTEGWLKNHLVTHSLPISIPLDKLPPRASSSSLTLSNYSRRSCLNNLIIAANNLNNVKS